MWFRVPGCPTGAQRAGLCFSAAHGELESFAAQLIVVLCKAQAEGTGRKQQAYIKHSLAASLCQGEIRRNELATLEPAPLLLLK